MIRTLRNWTPAHRAENRASFPAGARAGSGASAPGAAAVVAWLWAITGLVAGGAEPALPDEARVDAGARTASPVPIAPEGVRLTSHSSLVPVRPSVGREARGARELASHDPSIDWAPGPARAVELQSFSTRLMQRMTREAARYSLEHPVGQTGWAASPDSRLEEELSRGAERILTRSFNRTLDQHLEEAARSAPGLGRFLSWIETLGRGQDGREPAGAGRGAPYDGAVPRSLSGAAFLRIDAHPRLVLSGSYRRLRASVAVPLMPDDPLRLAIDRPVGARSRVSLTGALSHGEDDWARLSLTLGF